MIKMLVCDFDGTLAGGCPTGVDHFFEYIESQPDLLFVIATGRTYPSILEGLNAQNFPNPNAIISDVGTQIHHFNSKASSTETKHYPDIHWHTQLEQSWHAEKIEQVLARCPDIGKRNENHQGCYKVTIEGKLSQQQLATIANQLKLFGVDADLTYSHDWFLDITPKGVNKATAIEHLIEQHKIHVEEVCIAGDSANDTSMLTMKGVNSILVGNHYPEVAHLSSLNHVYTSRATHAAGVLEGFKHWQNIHRG